MITHEIGVSFLQLIIYLFAEHPFSFFVFIGDTETTFNHILKVILLEERKVCLLDAGHFIIGEPIRSLLLLDFIEQLSVKLLVVDKAGIVNQLFCLIADGIRRFFTERAV